MRAALLFSSLLFALPLLSTFHVSWSISAVVLLVFVVSVRRPEDGLLVIAGLLPLATPLGLLMRPEMSGTQAGELLLLPLLVAVSARQAVRATASPTLFGLAVVAAGALIASGIVTGLARDYDWTPILAPRHWAHLWRHVTTRYIIDAAAYQALRDGMVWLEGLVLALIACLTLRQAPAVGERACRLMVIGAAAAALLTANRLTEVFFRNEQSLQRTTDLLAGVRIGIHAADVNAVGSLYALFIVPALWLAVTDRRVWRWAALGSIALALWWTRSRTAVAAACCGVLLTALRTGAIGRRAIVVGLSLAAVVIALSLQSAVSKLSLLDGLRVRVEMAGIGLRMLEAHPGFGVGLGQFREGSRQLLSDGLVSSVYWETGQNAHNNFVQILAELGLVGACVIAAVIGLPLMMAWTPIAQPRSPPELAGLAGGAVAFLLTCLLGHPLLTPQCLWLFFLVLGIIAGLAGADPAAGRRVRQATALFVALVACSIPGRVM